MSSLPERVLATVQRHGMIPPGGRVLVAVSGGSDSVALLHLLQELADPDTFTLAAVAHLNHGLRAAAADDEAFCRSLADMLQLPFVLERTDVAAAARELRTSIEDAGRRARYAFLERAAHKLAADVVATGHTRDDQAETFLLRLVRGAGLRGLAAIRPKAGTVIRPLIDMRRSELREWLCSRGLTFREDETNADLTFARNRVRHELIPYLEREFSPGVIDVLARDAAIAREDDDRLEREAIDLVRSVVLSGEHADIADDRFEASSGPRVSAGRGTTDVPVRPGAQVVEVDAERLTSLHPALGSRVARVVLSILAPDRFVGFDHVERFLELARDRAGTAVSLPGQHAERRSNRIVLRREPGVAFANSFRVPLSIPGEAVLEQQGWAISARVGDVPAEPEPEPGVRAGSRFQVAVRADRLALPLAVRSRRPGDRLRPAGLGGRARKLQDVLVDRKVPRDERDSLPIVVDGHDRIVWVVGEPAAEDFRATEPLQGVIFLKARRLGGLG